MFNRKQQKKIAAIICAFIIVAMVVTMIFPYLG